MTKARSGVLPERRTLGLTVANPLPTAPMSLYLVRTHYTQTLCIRLLSVKGCTVSTPPDACRFDDVL